MDFKKLRVYVGFAFLTVFLVLFFQNCGNLASNFSPLENTSVTDLASSTSNGLRSAGAKEMDPIIVAKNSYLCNEKVTLTAQSYGPDGLLNICEGDSCTKRLNSVTSPAVLGSVNWVPMGFGRYELRGVNKNTTGFDQVVSIMVQDTTGKKSSLQKVILQVCLEAGDIPPVADSTVNVILNNERNEIINGLDNFGVFLRCGDAAKHAACRGSLGCNASLEFASMKADGSINLPIQKCAALGKDVWCERNGSTPPVALNSLTNGSKIICPRMDTDFGNRPDLWVSGHATQNGKPFLGGVYVDGAALLLNPAFDNQMEIECGNPEVYNMTNEAFSKSIQDGLFVFNRTMYFDKNGDTRFHRDICGDPTLGGGKVWAKCSKQNLAFYPASFKILTLDEFNSGKVLSCE